MASARDSDSSAKTAPYGPTSAPPVLREFIGQLTAGYRRMRDAEPETASPSEVVSQRLQTLQLADAALLYSSTRSGGEVRPVQVAVLGPTQTGKSTFVNLLFGRMLAQASPLAGFTVQPHGFWISPAGHQRGWITDLFPGWERREPGQLRREDRSAYALTTVEPQPAPAGQAPGEGDLPALASCVVWDTPDFDSLAAQTYSRGVLESIALADLYVLVLSKEKYSDLSVWHLLDLMAPLKRPLIICLNKVSPDVEQAVTQSLRKRLAEHGRSWGDVPIIALPYDAALAAGRLPADADMTRRLRGVGQEWLSGVRSEDGGSADGQRVAGVRALVQRHWDAWLAPIYAEQEAREQWQRLVAAGAQSFLEAYRRDYLDHPQRYDSFRRAALELLNLLEIPKVGGVIAQARRLLTWLPRQLMAAGESWWQQRRRAGAPVHSLGVEATVLVDAMNALLNGLQRDVARRCGPRTPASAWWQALEARLTSEHVRLTHIFDTAIHDHHAQVTREIQQAANSLYEGLQRHPTRLAALRTARATIDVGSLVLAIKTGGLTPVDAVWAPAAFTLTSLLMEGAAGLEMERANRALKATQRDAVEQGLIRGALVAPLEALADRLSGAGLFGISTDQVEAVTRALDAWEVCK